MPLHTRLGAVPRRPLTISHGASTDRCLGHGTQRDRYGVETRGVPCGRPGSADGSGSTSAAERVAGLAFGALHVPTPLIGLRNPGEPVDGLQWPALLPDRLFRLEPGEVVRWHGNGGRLRDAPEAAGPRQSRGWGVWLGVIGVDAPLLEVAGRA
jgi:hypothetical protein